MTTAQDTVDAGEDVTVEYTPQAARRPAKGRRSLRTEVLETTGDIVYLDNPYEDDDLRLVLDPDGDLWVRDESGQDGYFGSNAQVSA